MKMLCIDKGSYHLTIGKIYDVKEIPSESKLRELFEYVVTNDNGYNHYVESFLFKVMRDENLKTLGI